MIESTAAKTIELLAHQLNEQTKKEAKAIALAALSLFREINLTTAKQNEFEFSLVKNKAAIRLLHLAFPLNNKDKNFYRQRKQAIWRLLKKLDNTFGFSYNQKTITAFFAFNQSPLYPIQFGLETKGSAPRLKLYYSVNQADFDEVAFCREFNLPIKLIQSEINNKKLDCVALDLLPDQSFSAKFYPLLRPNQGFLLRINHDTIKAEKKLWLRLPAGQNWSALADKLSWVDPAISLFLQEKSLKIHYFCEEKNNPSFYFR